MSDKYIVCHDETGYEKTSIIVSESNIPIMLDNDLFKSVFEYRFDQGITGFKICKKENGDIVLTVQYWSYFDEYEETSFLLEKITLDFS
jgi:hypothetical protein